MQCSLNHLFSTQCRKLYQRGNEHGMAQLFDFRATAEVRSSSETSQLPRSQPKSKKTKKNKKTPNQEGNEGKKNKPVQTWSSLLKPLLLGLGCGFNTLLKPSDLTKNKPSFKNIVQVCAL